MPDPLPVSDVTPAAIAYPDALRMALRVHQMGDLEGAEKLYRILCDAMPLDPNPKHFLGVLLHQRGREGSLELIRESLAADGSVASWHNNHGNVLLDQGKLAEASEAYTRCIEMDPENVEALNNLGVLLAKLKRDEEAETVFKRALAKNPAFINAHTNLASLYYDQKRIDEGHTHIAAVLEQEPGDPAARKVLGLLYASLGRLDEAATIFREWLKYDPTSEQARHHLAACTSETTLERATAGYVEQVFDSFAGSFDAKLATLEYRAPQLVGEAIGGLLGVPEPRHRILDVGCGTGLCGPWLRRYAQTLVGVDLSGNMLEQARARGQYDELVKADLVTYLAGCQPIADLIVSADTLCYFGRLDSALQAARRALRRGGRLVFTVEAHEENVDFRLNPHGRYSHHESYLRTVLNVAGFTPLFLTHDQLRTERGVAVAGWVVAARAE